MKDEKGLVHGLINLHIIKKGKFIFFNLGIQKVNNKRGMVHQSIS